MKSSLKKITIRGYKSLGNSDKPVELNLKDINVIIGANGAGKSNLISFFNMLSHMMTGALQSYVAKNGSANSILQYGAKKTKTISAELVFKNDRFEDAYDFTLAKAINDTLIYSEEIIKAGNKRFELNSGSKESFLLSDNAIHQSEKVVKAILSGCRVFQFHDTSAESRIRNSVNINENRYLMSDGGNVAAYLYMLKKKYPRYYKRIEQHVRYVMPSFDEFLLEPMMLNLEYIRLEWREKNQIDYIFGPEHFSDGTIRFIALATLLLQPPELLPNVIFIDEPELGLHPQAVDALATLIKEAAKNVQIIVATQSARLVDDFELEDIVVAEKDRNINITHFKRLEDCDIKQWLEEYSISQLWDKNLIGGQP